MLATGSALPGFARQHAMTEYDFIIVGAGSAGCTLAARLTESGAHRVLLLEAGGSDRRLWIQLPIGYGKSFYDPRVNWMYRTEPEPELAGRQGYWPRGKVLGGSSSINAMVHVRGQAGRFRRLEGARQSGLGLERRAALLPQVGRLRRRRRRGAWRRRPVACPRRFTPTATRSARPI